MAVAEVLFFLLISLILIAVPLVAIATENSGRRADQQAYIVVLLIYVVSMIVIRYSLMAGAPIAIMAAEMLAGLVLTVRLLRITVQRVRDMGKPKAMAYVAALPVIGFLFQLYLTFPASASRPDDR